MFLCNSEIQIEKEKFEKIIIYANVVANAYNVNMFTDLVILFTEVSLGYCHKL